MKLMHKKGIGVGYVISVGGKNIYHAGDTDLIPEMGCIENVDIAFLPIGGRNFTMGLYETLHVAKKIKPKVIIPIHRFETDPAEYKKLVEEESSVKVEIVDMGEMYRL